MRTIAALTLALMTTACAIVEIHTADPDDVRLILWPAGVRIEAQPGAADGVAVSAIGVGLFLGCGVASIGLSKSSCTMIDSSVCGVAILSDVPNEKLQVLGKISDETRATCAHEKGTEQ